MSIVTQRYTLGISPGSNPPRIRCSMGDTSRDIKLLLYDSDGLFSIPNDVSAVVKGTKSNNVGFLHSCIVGDNYVVFTIVEDMSDIPGVVTCEIQLTDSSGGIVGTSNFIIQVENPALSDDSDIGDVDTDIITGIITDIEVYKSLVNKVVADYKDEVDDAIDGVVSAVAAHGTAIQNIQSQQSTFESRISGQVDAFIAGNSGNYGMSTLWESQDANGIIAKDTVVTLSESVESFDFVDIYSFDGDRNAIDIIPVDAILPDPGYTIRWTNVSTQTVKFDAIETRVTISGTVFTIANQYQYQAGQSTPVHQITQSNMSSYVGQFGILKVVGRKLVENAEVVDMRVGADGVTYQSAGAAIRAQFSAVNNKTASNIPYNNTNSGLSATNVQAAIDENTEELGNLDERLEELEQSGGSGGGLTADVKAALLACFNHVVWDSDDPTGQSYINALQTALYPPANLSSISAVFTQSGTVYDSDALDSLKSSLVVTAHYSDSTTETVTNYTLSGTLTEGTSTITVTYGGKTTTFTVTVTSSHANNSRWYTGGGLFRNVRVVATSKDRFFNRHPLYITTRDNRYVSVSAEFTNRTKDKATAIRLQILDPDGKEVYSTTTEIARHKMTRHQEARIVTDVEIADAKVWDIDSPYLYSVKAQLLKDDGAIADETCDEFGFRTIEFGPDFGLKLNGHKVLLKGYANHHTLGALGAAAYPKAIEKRLKLIKQFGMNHIRTSHNPYSRDFIRLCDKYGILVVDELYDKWTRQHTGGKVAFEQHWQQEVPEWVKRDRNSPSVILWSLGNELQQDPNMPFNDFGLTMYRLQKTLLQRYDSTRLVTVAMHPRYRNWETDSLPHDLAMITDIQAYNYRYMYFPGDGRRFPWMKFYQSEASTSAMGPNFFEMNLDKVIGLAYWGAIDYLGESQGWPAKGWSQGVFDISLEPKPKAYFMKSFFKPEEPLVHIAVIDSKNDVMWNGVQTGNDGMSDHWCRQPGEILSLITYTNADEVELILNGKKLGRKLNPKNDPKLRNQIKWDSIQYADGKLLAIAYNGGKEVARHQIETTGKAVKLSATAEDNTWKADGTDLMHIRIQAVDNKGRRVPMAQDELHFSVEGDASIVAVTNGDINSEELNVQDHRRLYNGSAMVILRSGKSPSKITLKTSSPNFKSIKNRLETK